ncbi:MAG: DsrH/TusB family sulfur metabolism protein [Candidatus Desulfatibia sp.]|uniref:DsrH/TusB family sulfur metabolism protein n=1 Tax=Candidatus Desulfatibia sp. TaxID=3101189 RepID=UPI002F343622
MLYLIDIHHRKIGFEYAKMDPEAKVVLIQDGVFTTAAELPDVPEVFAVKEDVERRAIAKRLGDKVKLIDYDELVDLLMSNKVINFA